uniref:Uncharacterized protein n=1 Tax=viral metagenome TaxID=1070528 RepID=A0A6C0DV81_9ZZZZ
MRYLKTILNRFLPKQVPKPMGRWGNEKCHVKVDQKIDLSNEDHCGPCGQYALLKTELNNRESSLIDNKKSN